jgi:hypothetical protein
MKSTKRFSLSVEALEERAVLNHGSIGIQPLIPAYMSGDTLIVRGSNAVDDVKIIQNDQANLIYVIFDPAGENSVYGFGSSSVKKIDVKLYGGSDYLQYELGYGSSLDTDKEVTIDLGSGNDMALFQLQDNGYPNGNPPYLKGSFALHFEGGDGDDSLYAGFPRFDGGSLRVAANMGNGNDYASLWTQGSMRNGAVAFYDVNGGAGDDTLGVSFYNPYIHEGSEAHVRLCGDYGNDTLYANYDGYLDGLLDIQFLGDNESWDDGLGDDRLSVDVRLGETSYGTVNASSYGMGGYDQLHMHIYDDTGLAAVNAAVACGGDYFDQYDLTSNVQRLDEPNYEWLW